MILTVTQNINKLNLTVTQNNTVVELQPIINQTGSTSGLETDPVFTASEAYNFVSGDKDKLDNQSGINTGDETTTTIQTKRPLKTINGDSLEGIGDIQINYNDLNNLPTIVDTNFISVATLPTTGIDLTKLYKLPDGSFNWYDGSNWNEINKRKLDVLQLNDSVSVSYAIDFNIDTHRLTLTGNTTFTESNLPVAGFTKTITLHIKGNFGLIFPTAWNTYISGEYDGTASLNTIVVETIGTERKVQISQPD